MVEPPAHSGRRWPAAVFLAALTTAVAAFGGLLLPRLAADAAPASLRVGAAGEARLVRVERPRACRRGHRDGAVVPPLSGPRDR